MTDSNQQPTAATNTDSTGHKTTNEALFDVAESMEQWADMEVAATEELDQTITELEQDSE